jgi:hypothetical protein
VAPPRPALATGISWPSGCHGVLICGFAAVGMAVASVGCEKTPPFSSEAGWYQLPAPPRPMWAYSWEAVCEVGAGDPEVVAVDEGAGRFASRSWGLLLGAWFCGVLRWVELTRRTSAAFLLVSFACAMLPAPPRPYIVDFGLLNQFFELALLAVHYQTSASCVVRYDKQCRCERGCGEEKSIAAPGGPLVARSNIGLTATWGRLFLYDLPVGHVSWNVGDVVRRVTGFVMECCR